VARNREGLIHASTRPGRAAVNSTDSPHIIAVASDRSLIADAVSAALSGNGLVVVRLPWPDDLRGRPAGWPPGSDTPELGLMLCDLQPASVETARWVVAGFPTRWLLLTDAPRGPLWGAMLEAGVVAILESSTTFVDVLETIEAVREGTLEESPSDRRELVEAWRREQAERAAARERLGSLTRREREVLTMIHLGHSVGEIAERNGVAPSTVRSQVRSILRKLGVSSQLAASALFEKWGGD
jgi:two-component system, NarL family, nitrate/nitrite response regulator NarL